MSETIYCWFVCISNASTGMQMKHQNQVINVKKKKDCPHKHGEKLFISTFNC